MIGTDDPRLTAYAVDEVDAETAAAVERALRDHVSIAAAVGETRDAARLVTALFASEETLALREDQRRAIAEAAARVDQPYGRRGLAIGGGLAAAATVVLAVLLTRGPETVAPPAPLAPSVATPTPDVPAVVPTPGRPEERIVLAPVPTRRPPSRSPQPTTEPATESVTELSPEPATAAAPGTVIVRGKVTDESGAFIPGAVVTARSLGTGGVSAVTTGADGTFELKGVPPGPLEVRTDLQGFATAVDTVSGQDGAVVALNQTLRIAGMVEAIEVAAESPVVATSSTARSRSIRDESVENLPKGRDLTTLATQAPGGTVRIRSGEQHGGTESYGYRAENAFTETRQHPLSTFSLDVDTASYSNVRRFLEGRSLPPADAVRIEELVNYFPYDYAQPKGPDRFAADLEVAPAPWKPEHRLLRIGLKTADLDLANRPAANFVFLVDVSGSMNQPNKLPLVQQSLRLLVDQLAPRDRVALVVYAGSAGLVLPSTAGDEQGTIVSAIDRLRAGGSTNGGQGIELAYAEAARNFVKGGVNRVVLATDGDFNVGVTSEGGLVRLVEEKAKGGVFLSVLGYGMGNLKDSTMEALADKGNGNYAYIDSLREARKALVEQMAGTLVTVAKDAKIQVEFNPALVRAYRLLGYENRLLRPEDFKDDTKDAGEVGAGHTVTALYEIVPAAVAGSGRPVDPLRYVAPGQLTDAARSGELLRLKLRYKEPEGRKSRQQQWTLVDRGQSLSAASDDFRFAAAVAGFGMLLRDATDKGAATYASVLELAESSRGDDGRGYRDEFIGLVKKARSLAVGASEQPDDRP
jgi:Ca-activated chloride channel homolog